VSQFEERDPGPPLGEEQVWRFRVVSLQCRP